jgi:hypothetical protein
VATAIDGRPAPPARPADVIGAEPATAAAVAAVPQLRIQP